MPYFVTVRSSLAPLLCLALLLPRAQGQDAGKPPATSDPGATARAELAPKETVVIFCNMSNWDAEKRVISQNSPYYAGGSIKSGTAWQVDSPILDLDSLADNGGQVQDGQYGKISIGRYNSIFIGGIAHELGHALSLPHCKARPDEAAAFGTSLMGSGNRTYGEDRRHDGRGTFLTLGEALRDRLPEPGGLLIAGGELYAHGFCAHAVATHEWQIDGTWKALTGVAGIADGSDGSVQAVIEGDGKVLWQSSTFKDGKTAAFDVKLEGVKKLVLKMTDAGDGKRSEWGVWLEPILAR